MILSCGFLSLPLSIVSLINQSLDSSVIYQSQSNTITLDIRLPAIDTTCSSSLDLPSPPPPGVHFYRGGPHTSTATILKRMDSLMFDFPSRRRTVLSRRIDYIHLRSHSNLPLLASRLRDHAYAETQQLIIVCPGCEPDWRSDEVTTLFRSLKFVTHLLELKLNCVGLLDVAFPLRLLTEVVENSPDGLRSLELDDVALTAQSDQEVVDLARAIETKSRLGHLRHFRLFGCLADETLHLSTTSLDPLWASLATLKRVELDAVDDGLLGSIQPPTVGYLGRSTTLQHFHLNGFALDDGCLLQLAHALQHNATLLDLSLDLYSAGHTGQGALALAESLRPNRQLKRLHLSISHAWNDEVFLRALADALSTDCSLVSLIIGTCASIRDATAKAFCEMLTRNCALELLQLSRYNGEWKPRLAYYLLLNSQRRGYFHAHYTSLPRWEWIEGLINVRMDLDGLYYFLHMNPLIYCGEVKEF